MINLVKCGKIEKLIDKNITIKNIKNIFDKNELEQDQLIWFEDKINKSNFNKKIRLLYYFASIIIFN